MSVVAFDAVVHEQHLVRRHGGKESIGAFLRPHVRRVDEDPSLERPHGVGIRGLQRAVDVASARLQPLARRLVAVLEPRHRARHLDEAVAEVVFSLAELLLPLAHDLRADLHEERIVGIEEPRMVASAPRELRHLRVRMNALQASRNRTREALRHHVHAERTQAFVYCMLERHGSLPPRRRQMADRVVHAAHAREREIRRSRERRLDLSVGQAVLFPHPLENRLERGDGVRQIVTVKRHPVDLAHPARLVPERGGVGRRAGLHVEVAAERRDDAQVVGRRTILPHVRVETVATPRTDTRALARNVRVERLRERRAVGGAETPSLLQHLEHRTPRVERDDFKRKLPCNFFAREARNHTTRSLDLLHGLVGREQRGLVAAHVDVARYEREVGDSITRALWVGHERMGSSVERTIRVHELPAEVVVLREHIAGGDGTPLHAARTVEELQQDALQMIRVHHLHLDAQTRRLAIHRRQHDLVEPDHVSRTHVRADGGTADFVRLHVGKRPSFQHQCRLIRRHHAGKGHRHRTYGPHDYCKLYLFHLLNSLLCFSEKSFQYTL